MAGKYGTVAAELGEMQQSRISPSEWRIRFEVEALRRVLLEELKWTQVARQF